MKLLLAILLISFISIGAHGSRVKRGLSADEQKKFLEELNKDRQEIGKKAGLGMNIVQYDMALEKKAESMPCGKNESGVFGVPLQFDSTAQEVYEIGVKHGFSVTAPLFWPTATKIGCSKTSKCSIPLDEKDVSLFGEKFRGKTTTVQGVCFTDIGAIRELDDNILLNLNKTGLPHPSKYGDLLGVPKPMEDVEVGTSATITSSGNAFNIVLTLFLVFILFIEK